MDRRLQLIAHLYDEDVEGLEPLGALLEDPELRAEFEALGEARFRLELREYARPDPRLIDAVVAAALRRDAPSRPADRGALRLVRDARFWVPAMATAAATLLFVLVRPATAPETLPFGDPIAGAFPPAESLLMTLPPPPPNVLPAVAGSRGSEDVPIEWDTGDDLRRLSRRISLLRTSGIDDWGSPAVPLEAFPTGSRSDQLLPAGARRPGQ